MIDPRTIKSQLGSMPLRATRAANAKRWATGDMGVPEDLLPDVTEAARKALRRIAKQCQSLGPRVIGTKVTGTIGSVTWGGNDTRMDELLREADLESLAEDVLEGGLSSGIMAGIARRDPGTGRVHLEPLLGHVEPVYAPDSPTLVAGILHAWTITVNGTPRWTVRLYDFQERTMTEWANLGMPSDAATKQPADRIGPSAAYPDGAPMPRFQIMGRDDERMPKGEMAKLLPLLYADWSSQVRGSRIEEATAIPQMVIKGELERGDDERSPTHTIRVIEDGDAHYIVPGDLSGLHTHHNRILERVREDGSLPGGFLGSQTPSGEALQEANAKFISWCKRAAARLGRLLTELARDLAIANGIRGAEPLVTVEVNREFTKQQDVADAVTLYEKGLVEHGAAVRHITPFIPTWEDEDVEAFIEREARPLTAQAFQPSAASPDEGE